jgi:predicted TPR repeat methyltransferase
MPAPELFDKALKAFQAKNYKKANKLCDRVMKKQPLNHDALHLAGLLAVNRGDKLAAIELIGKSIAIQPSQPSAHNNIGIVFRKLDRFDEALMAFREATRQKPDFADAWANMALVYYYQDQNSSAADTAKTALKLEPDHLGATHTMGLVHIINDELDEAAAAFMKCSQHESSEGFSPIWYAQIFAHLGRLQEAEQVLGEILEHNPDDASARFQYDAIVGKKLERAPEDAVKNTFDSFAANFDKTLRNLDYRAPELVAAQVMKLYSVGVDQLSIADLGCGTGLVGPLLAPVSKYLVGVDLSPKMLSQAQKLAMYDELIEADLITFLSDSPRDKFDLITCADTLVYLGALEQVMQAVAHALLPGGHFIATAENLDTFVDNTVGYHLHHAGRFAHTEAYIRKTLKNAGLTLLQLDHKILRKQGGKPVRGMVFSAFLPISSHS